MCEFPYRLEIYLKNWHLQTAICFNGSNYVYTITISTDEFYNVFKILDFNKALYIEFGNGFWKLNPKI